MKLLQKSDIQSKKAAETQQAIQEGIKLARRVDGLREVVSQEEASLENFRRETLARIHGETTEAAEIRDALRQEVSELQKRREEALEPLTAELDAIRNGIAQLVQDREALDLRESSISSREEELARESLAVRDQFSRAEEELRRSNALLQEADSKHGEAELARQSAQESSAKAAYLESKAESYLRSIEETAVANERRHEERDKQQDKRERDLNARETRIKDRELLLERTIARHGTKHRNDRGL